MARAFWNGYIALGRLGIPVQLYAAVQAPSPSFVQLHKPDLSPVERVLRCKAEHKSIDARDVVRGVEHEPGRYVTLSDDEIARSAQSATKVIAIQQFAFDDAVAPQYYDKPFYLVPSPGGEQGYALLREVFAGLHRMAIVTYVYRNRAHLGAIRAEGDMLLLMQLRYTAELVPRSEIQTPALNKPTPQEIDALTAVVERFGGLLYMQDYHDEYVERIRQLIERKVRGLPEEQTNRDEPSLAAKEDILRELKDILHRSGHKLIEPGLFS